VGEIPAEARELLDMAVRNTERLIRLINDILDLEKIEAGKLDFTLAPVPLAEVLRDAIAENRSYGEQFDVRYSLASEIPAVEVLADRVRLLQVLANLLSNGAKFSPEGGDVVISAVQAERCVQISVADQGEGIPQEFRDMLFDKFTQASAVNTRKLGGTGLGLSICRAIMEEMGGRIDFESEVGTGTTFFIDVPLHASRNASEKASPKILVCEDSPDIALLLRMMLERMGFCVDVAGSAADARRRVAQERYVAMTLDLDLPDQPRIELLRQLRVDPELGALPIIVVSASADQERKRLRGDAMEIVDWINKPIDPARLARAVELSLRHASSAEFRVLHVEDDPDIRQLVRKLLGERVELISAATLTDARVELRRGSIDLLILDIGLPDGSGLDLLAELPGEAAVILFSAQDAPEELRGRVEAVLVKAEAPPEQLEQTILDLVAGKGAGRLGPSD
jgi:DNA-binding response OmpR family regulator/anti-sigma regulatory factor (Ser/Thr protein kinase)